MFRTMECTFDDLTVWRTALPHVEHALLPPASDRPNPRLGHGLLFTSVFSPGCVYAMDAATGEIQWRRELPYFGGDSVELAGDLLFAKTSQSLYALEPASGSVRWEFCPYGSEGEMLYSLPRLYGKRLIIGDRQGWLHCLDADSGQTIWKRQTSDAQVNATAVVASGLAITANNAHLALAYAMEDGRPVWQFELDGPCTKQLFLVGDHVAIAAESLYFLKPSTGELQARAHWPGLRVSFAAGTPTQVALFRGPSRSEMESGTGERGESEESLLVLEGGTVVREMRCSEHASALRYSHATGLLYVTGLTRLDILNPLTSEWLYALNATTGRTGECGLPEATRDAIYTLTGDGVVYALRHPDV